MSTFLIGFFFYLFIGRLVADWIGTESVFSRVLWFWPCLWRRSLPNRLRGMRVYLAGGIDRESDGGHEWRDRLTPQLEKLGMVVMNPLKKPVSGNAALENDDSRISRAKLKRDGKYDDFSDVMRAVRAYDLRMVDISDVLILRLTENMCGSWEETFWANRLKRPIIVLCGDDMEIVDIPDWMWGVCPHELFFDDECDAIAYLKEINNSPNPDHMKRWVFFDKL
jgi:hypothetical protein